MGLAKGKDFFALKDENPLKSFMMIGEAVSIICSNLDIAPNCHGEKSWKIVKIRACFYIIIATFWGAGLPEVMS